MPPLNQRTKKTQKPPGFRLKAKVVLGGMLWEAYQQVSLKQFLEVLNAQSLAQWEKKESLRAYDKSV